MRNIWLLRVICFNFGNCYININIFYIYLKLYIKGSVQQHINFAAVSKLILRNMKIWRKKKGIGNDYWNIVVTTLFTHPFLYQESPIEEESWKESPIVDIGKTWQSFCISPGFRFFSSKTDSHFAPVPKIVILWKRWMLTIGCISPL